jgi:uncharacterized membrane protein
LTKERPADRLILMIDDLAVARAIHVLAVVHWIGGMAAVTTIVLPHARLLPDANAAVASFETFERRFARQARISVTLTGVSGIYMLWRLAAWKRFESPSFWWLHLMVALWILFVLMLFVLEPLGIDRLFRSYALREKEHAFALATWLHSAALLIATPACWARTAICRSGRARPTEPLAPRASARRHWGPLR